MTNDHQCQTEFFYVSETTGSPEELALNFRASTEYQVGMPNPGAILPKSGKGYVVDHRRQLFSVALRMVEVRP